MRPDLDTVPDQGTDTKLTAPLGGAVKFILILAAVLLAIVLIFAVFGKIGLFGLGSGRACSGARTDGIAVTATAGPLAHLRPGVTSGGGQVLLCTSHPTAGQRLLVSLTQVPEIALYLAVVLLLAQLLRGIRTAGPFAVTVARRLRFLGWFVLAGSLVVAVGESMAQSAFASTMVTGSVPAVRNAVNAGITVLFVPLLIACGLLMLARVIRVGARMSDDLAGTV
jgi:Protein of unknown function (DUF2975)